MFHLNIDNSIVIIFLLITLVFGLCASRNIKDIAEYAIGNKVLGSGIVAITILATYITGSKGIGYAGYVFDDGILPMLPTIFCGVIFCFLFIIFFILPHIKYFDGCLTTAELMGQIYGIKTRFTVGILGSFYTTTLVILQIIWFGDIAVLLGMSKLWGVIVGGIFLIIYASIGGIKSITITDFIQCIAVTVMIPIIAYVVLNKVGGIESLITKMPKHYFDIVHHPNLKDYLIYCVWYIFPAFPLSFPFIQRMLMARNSKQLTDSYYISMLFLIIFFVLLTLIGLSAIVLKETGDIDMPARGSEVMTYLIHHYFFAGAKGMLAIGLIAMVLSTADSFLNTGALLLAHDVIKPVCDTKNININELKWARYITCGLGVMAVCIASVHHVLPRIQYAGIVDLAKGINIASEIVALVFTIPLIAGIIGLKGSPLSFFIPAIITTVTFMMGKLFFDHALLIPISVAINLMSFFTIHYILNKGFIMIKRDETFVPYSPIQRKYFSKLFTSLKYFAKQFIRSFQPEMESYGIHANIFALFMVFNYMLPIFMYSYAEPNLYHWILLLRIIGGLMCMGLLLKPYWPSILEIYFPAYYHLTLLYCLPFSTTFIFLLEKGHVEWLINITFAIILLIVLLNWIAFIVLSITGTLLACIIYYALFNSLIIQSANIMYTLAYTCFFSVMIGIIFLRRNQQYLYMLFNNQQTLRELYSATTDQLIDALNYQEKLAHGLGKEGLEILKQAQKVTNNLRKQMIADSSEAFTKAYNRLTSVAKYLEEVATQAKDYIRLEVGSMDINVLLNGAHEKIMGSAHAPRLAIFNSANCKTIECDIHLTKKLLINTIMQVYEYKLNNNYIQIFIDSTELWYRIDSIKNYTKKIPAIRFVVTTLEKMDALPNFYMGDTTKAAFTLNSQQDVYKAESIKIINAHYGALHYRGFNNEYSVIFVIPLHIRDIRPESMDLKENQSISQEVIVDSLGAKEVEIKLLQKLNKKNPAIDIKQIKKAISLIKKYHAKQTRKSGEHFYIHPLIVTDILLQFTADEDALLSSLLHDIIEDTSMCLSTIEAMFNPTVAKLVSGVTKFEQSRKKLNLPQHENIQKLIEQEDVRVLMIKIADRMHNMRTITYHSSYEKQKKIAEETLLFYIPTAKQLGFAQAAVELQNLVFEVLNKEQTTK